MFKKSTIMKFVQILSIFSGLLPSAAFAVCNGSGYNQACGKLSRLPDGSINVTNPTVFYQGKERQIASFGFEPYNQMARGFCARIGYPKLMDAVSDWDGMLNADRVVLAGDGSITDLSPSSFWTDPIPTSVHLGHTVHFTSITCAQ